MKYWQSLPVVPSFSLLPPPYYMFCTMSDDSLLFSRYIWCIVYFWFFPTHKSSAHTRTHKQTHKYVYNHNSKWERNEKGWHGVTRVVKWGVRVLALFGEGEETEGEEGDTLMVKRGDVIHSFSTCCCCLLSLLTSLLHGLHTLRPLIGSLTLNLLHSLCLIFFYTQA